MKKMYKYFCDVGRMGHLDGLFVADDEDVRNSIGMEVYFGEVLGKYSEVYGELAKDEVTEVTDNHLFIDMAVKLLGNEKWGRKMMAHGEAITLSGYNPLLAIDDEEEEVA
jgi:hypothetical protein